MIEIDGAHGEGGGQLLRVALALSALTRQAVHVTNIRAGRRKPGLARQHLTAVEGLARLCAAKVEGAVVGSQEVAFRPGGLHGGHLDLDVQTAGSVTLVLQAIVLPALFAPHPTTVRIRGGTDVRWSPPVDYTQRVFLPHLALMGGEATLLIGRRGYYPRGGGRIRAEITPLAHLAPYRAERIGDTLRIGGHAHISNLPANILERMNRRTEEALQNLAPVALDTSVYGSQEAVGRGGALVLWAETATSRLGASALVEKGVRAETVGDRAAADLRADVQAGVTVDRFTADQLLPFMALASGPSVFLVREVSGHLKTLFWLLPRFLELDVRTRQEAGRTRVEVKPSRTWRSTGTPPAAGPRGPDG